MDSPRVALIVDDERSVREVISRHLENEGWVSILVGNVEEARRVLEGVLPDVMLIDVRLPNGDGRHLVRDYPHIPAVVMSGWGEEDVLNKAEIFAQAGRLKREIESSMVRYGANKA